jgi:hypothetical protein
MRNRTTLNEAKAWREIARRIDALATGVEAFLCWYVNPVYRCPQILDAPEKLLERMQRRLTRHLGATGFMYCDEYTDAEKRQQRILACLFLALEAEESRVSVDPTERKTV